MKINFVTFATDKVASYRYHNQIPAEALARRGHEVSITSEPISAADVYIFSKHWNYQDREHLAEVSGRGAKTVFHCCDNHFADKHRNHYEIMISDADVVIATTPEMASVIKQFTGRDARVIPDGYEFDEKEPCFEPGERLSVLWFGHPSNLGGLYDCLDDLQGCALKVCTKPGILSQEKFDVVPYSEAELLKCFRWCDVVIIPSRLGEKDLVKSHNRLVESIRSGKFVIASPLPSYKEYSDWVCIGNIKDGIEALKLMDKESVESSIKLAQAYIRENYSPERIGELWEKSLG